MPCNECQTAAGVAPAQPNDHGHNTETLRRSANLLGVKVKTILELKASWPGKAQRTGDPSFRDIAWFFKT